MLKLPSKKKKEKEKGQLKELKEETLLSNTKTWLSSLTEAYKEIIEGGLGETEKFSLTLIWDS